MKKFKVKPLYSLVLSFFVYCSIFPQLTHAEETDSARLFTTSAMRDETQYVVRCMERVHYLSEPISDIDTEAFIENYISDLDMHHLFFKHEDVEGYKKRFGASVSRFLHQGNLYQAFTIFKDYRDIGNKRIEWVLERLKGDFTFDDELTYTPDRDEAPWPVTDEEADSLWERRIKYELLNEILSQYSSQQKKKTEAESTEADDAAESDASKEIAESEAREPGETRYGIEDYDAILVEAQENVSKRYERMLKTLNEIESSEVQEMFLTSLTQMYDPHSTFLSADSLEEFAIAMRNSLVGIGAILSEDDGYCTIRELLPGGPAEKSQELMPEDKIVGVGQGENGEFVDVIGMKLRKVVKMIRGKKGSTVRLLIRPADGDPGERKELLLTRDEIKLTANLAKAEVFNIPNGNKTVPLGVIDLPAFYGSGSGKSSTTADVEELINKLKEVKVEGIILDLRRNGGGLLSEAISLTGLFIPIGPVVQVRDSLANVKEHMDTDPKVAWDGPLIVLVSRYSASASEIAAGALKNHGRALIVGDEETHGKGSVQAVFEINQGGFLSALKPKRGAAKITIQKYYLPDGTSTQIRGVNSDIILPSINKYLPIGEGDLPNALAWDSIKSLDWDYGVDFKVKGPEMNSVLTDNLMTRSKERQSELQEFKYLQDSIDWFRQRQEQKVFSLNLLKRIDLKARDNDFRNEMEERLEALADNNYDMTEILLDVTEEQNAEHDKILAESKAKQAAEKSEQVADAGDSEEALDTEEAKEEDSPRFDIHLRESLRILADWLTEGSDQSVKKVVSNVKTDKGV